jgi:hypothetical protein
MGHGLRDSILEDGEVVALEFGRRPAARVSHTGIDIDQTHLLDLADRDAAHLQDGLGRAAQGVDRHGAQAATAEDPSGVPGHGVGRLVEDRQDLVVDVQCHADDAGTWLGRCLDDDPRRTLQQRRWRGLDEAHDHGRGCLGRRGRVGRGPPRRRGRGGGVRGRRSGRDRCEQRQDGAQ